MGNDPPNHCHCRLSHSNANLNLKREQIKKAIMTKQMSTYPLDTERI